jgi:ferredoxin
MLWLIVILLPVLCLITAWLIGERGHLMLPSTRRSFRAEGVRSVFRFQTWHLYVYGCWSTLYVGFLIHCAFRCLAALGAPGRNWLAHRYHGKVLTLDHARALVTVDKPIALQDLEQVIPYKTARRLLLETPLEMAVYECPCRLSRPHPCQPTQVCMIIGQPFVDLVLDHHPRSSRRLSRDEALELLAAEHRRGHVHIAWFKDACLHRFFAICNCCKCCCGGIDAMQRHGIPMVTSSGYVATCDPQKCLACGICSANCPFAAVQVNGHAQIDRNKCLGCGVCVGHCDARAMSLVHDPSRGTPLDVRYLQAPSSASNGTPQSMPMARY